MTQTNSPYPDSVLVGWELITQPEHPIWGTLNRNLWIQYAKLRLNNRLSIGMPTERG
jgi:hypothetical protein